MPDCADDIVIPNETYYTVTTERLRQLCGKLRLSREFGSKEVEAFMFLHGDQFKEIMNYHLLEFLKSKLQ